MLKNKLMIILAMVFSMVGTHGAKAENEAKKEEAKAYDKNLWKEKFDETLKNYNVNKPKILILADTNHSAKSLKHFFADFIVHNSTYQCLILETDDVSAADLQQYSDDKMTFEQVIEEYHKRRNSLGYIDSEVRRDSDRKRLTEEKIIIDQAKKLKMKVFGHDVQITPHHSLAYAAIDDEDPSSHQNYIDYIFLGRNAFMASRILYRLKNNCSNAIVIIGNLHLLPNYQDYFSGYVGPKVLSVTEYLESLFPEVLKTGPTTSSEIFITSSWEVRNNHPNAFKGFALKKKTENANEPAYHYEVIIPKDGFDAP